MTSTLVHYVSNGDEPHLGDRNIVRNSYGNIYVVSMSNHYVTVCKSSNNGASFAVQDDSNSPYSSSGYFYESCVCVIDSADIIHIAYDHDTNAYYSTFDTSTDEFVILNESIKTFASGTKLCNINISIDSSDIPHVCFDLWWVTDSTFYNNRIGGTWSNEIVVISDATASHSLSIDKDDKPWIVYQQYNTSSPYNTNTYACIGNANDPTSFTTQFITSLYVQGSYADWGVSLAIDVNGNHYIALLYEPTKYGTQYIAFIKHNYSDSWSTWQSIVTGPASTGYDDFQFVSLMIEGSDLHILYTTGGYWESQSIKYITYINSTWSDPVEIASSSEYFYITGSSCKWEYWVDNDEQGNNVGITGGRKLMEFVYCVEDWGDDYSYSIYYCNTSFGETTMRVIMIIEDE